MSAEPCKTCDWFQLESPRYTVGLCWRFGGAALYKLDGCGNYRARDTHPKGQDRVDGLGS